MRGKETDSSGIEWQKVNIGLQSDRVKLRYRFLKQCSKCEMIDAHIDDETLYHNGEPAQEILSLSCRHIGICENVLEMGDDDTNGENR